MSRTIQRTGLSAKMENENKPKAETGIEAEATRDSNPVPATGFSGLCHLKCETTVSEVIGQILIWIILSLITAGLALIVMPYYFIKAILNRTYVVDSQGLKIARLEVEVSFGGILGHVLIWLLLSILTAGLAYIVYWPMVLKRLLNSAEFTGCYS